MSGTAWTRALQWTSVKLTTCLYICQNCILTTRYSPEFHFLPIHQTDAYIRSDWDRTKFKMTAAYLFFRFQYFDTWRLPGSGSQDVSSTNFQQNRSMRGWAIMSFCDDTSCTRVSVSACSVITRDDACASKQALGNAIDMWVNESVDIYLGPPCSIGKYLCTSFIDWRTVECCLYSRSFCPDLLSPQQRNLLLKLATAANLPVTSLINSTFIGWHCGLRRTFFCHGNSC